MRKVWMIPGANRSFEGIRVGLSFSGKAGVESACVGGMRMYCAIYRIRMSASFSTVVKKRKMEMYIFHECSRFISVFDNILPDAHCGHIFEMRIIFGALLCAVSR